MAKNLNDYLLTVCETFDILEKTSSLNRRREIVAGFDAVEDIAIIAKELYSISLSKERHLYIRKLPEYAPSSTFKTQNAWAEFTSLVADLESKAVNRETAQQRISSLLGTCPEVVSKWLGRVIIKDLRMGASKSIIHKQWPELLPQFDCMLAESFSEEDIDSLDFPLLVEPKLDGVRVIGIVEKKKATWFTRNGKPVYNVEAINKELETVLTKLDMDDCVIDGELFAGSYKATMKLTKTSKKKPDPKVLENLKLICFDILKAEEWGEQKGEVIQKDRSALVYSAFKNGDKIIPVMCVAPFTGVTLGKNSAELKSLYKQATDAKLEGLILKKPDAVYEFDRSKSWLKYKPFVTGDFKITGLFEGEGNAAGSLGSFEILMSNGTTCKVGGGFSQAQRKEYWKLGKKLVGKIAEVEYKELTPDGKLREPVFVHLREDR